MIKRFIKWLFEKEVKAILTEAQSILSASKESGKVKYVKYDRLDIESNEFLFKIKEILDNTALLSWLNGKKEACLMGMREKTIERDEKAVMLGMAQINMIDALLLDIEGFKSMYAQRLEEIKAAEHGKV